MTTQTAQSTEKIWSLAKNIYLSTLQDESERNHAELYFGMISGVEIFPEECRISTTTAFAADFLRENYSERLKSSLNLAGVDANLALNFVVDTTAKRELHLTPSSTVPSQVPAPSLHKEIPSAPTVKSAQMISTLPLEENYTFESFVEGQSNSWALAAARGVSKYPGQKNYNPLFIHGGTGLGKTHLMQAIGNEIRRNNPQTNICYITAETFLNEFVNALQNKEKEAFRLRYRSADVLLVDDIQFLQRGTQCQEEFFNTFNDLTTRHKQIVMTSDVAPKKLPSLEQRLISRFEGGMVQEIEAPGYETRLAILQKKAELLDHSVPLHVLQFLAEHIKSHVRAIEGALAKVHIAISSNPTIQLTTEALSTLLKDVIENESKLRKLTIREIQEVVAKKFSVTLAQILSNDRTQTFVTARQMAMYISRKYTPMSVKQIGKEFDKQHPTIVHGWKTIARRLDVESDLRETLTEILNDLGISNN